MKKCKCGQKLHRIFFTGFKGKMYKCRKCKSRYLYNNEPFIERVFPDTIICNYCKAEISMDHYCDCPVCGHDNDIPC